MKRILLFAGGSLLALVLVAVLALALIVRAHRLDKTESVRAEPAMAAGTYRWTLHHDGRERRYIVHVPEGLEAGKSVPLVLALHGGGGSYERTDDLMKLTPIADRERFVVAFPDGIDRGWNDGRKDAEALASREDVDDVGFLRALIDELASKLPVDPKRVFAMGISNGAMMSGRLACELSDRIAAVGMVVGTGPVGLGETCKPGRPVAVVAFHGTKDPLVPYGGGTVRALLPGRDRGEVVSVAELKSVWVRNNGCAATPVVSDVPDTDTSDASRIVMEAHGSCRAGADVVFYRMDGAGHTWPGGRQYSPERVIGVTNRDVDASEVIWHFFSEHGMP